MRSALLSLAPVQYLYRYLYLFLLLLLPLFLPIPSPALANHVFLDAEIAAVQHNIGGLAMQSRLCQARRGQVLDGMDVDGEYLEWSTAQTDSAGSMRALIGIKSAADSGVVRTFVVQIWDQEDNKIFEETMQTPPGQGAEPWPGTILDWVQSNEQCNLSAESAYRIRMTMIDHVPGSKVSIDYLQLIEQVIPVERLSWGRIKTLYGR